MPKLVLTNDQKKLLAYMTEVGVNRTEVEESLASESVVSGKTVVFSEQERRAILANPTAYGLTIQA